jgi:hypothetical protein
MPALFAMVPRADFERLAWPFDAYAARDRLIAWAALGAIKREVVADENPWQRDRLRATARSRTATARSRTLVEQGRDGVPV